MDTRPPSPSKIQETFDEPSVWGGYMHDHFGHYISEHSTRILQSKQLFPDRQFIFSGNNLRLNKTGKYEDSSRLFRSVIEWLGLERNQVIFCTAVTKVANLSVTVQAEQAYNITRSTKIPALADEYFDLLDENRLRNKLVPQKNDIVFVSRSMLRASKGNHAGSAYVDSVLASLGVKVVYPEKLSLIEQLEIYAGAENLIFSEGSAIHGLQLLGRGLKSVSVLNRRTNSHLAELNLKPRCESLEYINANSGFYRLLDKKGIPIPAHLGITTLNIDRLIDRFGNIGIDLSKKWDSKKFAAAQIKSFQGWLDSNFSKVSITNPASQQPKLIASLEKGGLKNVAQALEERLKLVS